MGGTSCLDKAPAAHSIVLDTTLVGGASTILTFHLHLGTEAPSNSIAVPAVSAPPSE